MVSLMLDAIMLDDLLFFIACYLPLLVDRISFSRSHRRFATLLRPMIAEAKERPAAAAAALGLSHLHQCATVFLNDPQFLVFPEASIAETLKFNKVLTLLTLQWNKNGPIMSIGATSIGNELACNAVLTELKLVHNRLDLDTIKALASALKVNVVLKKLQISGRIGDKGVRAIAEALKVNSVLTELYLDTNVIEDEGTSSIAKALMVNKVLTVLALDNNFINVVGSNAIAKSLEVNTTLTSLNLDYNELCGSGKAFRKALETNSSLKLLKMKACDLCHNDNSQLSCGIFKNMSLTSLDLSYNGLNRAKWLSLILRCPSLTQLDISGEQLRGDMLTMVMKAASKKESFKLIFSQLDRQLHRQVMTVVSREFACAPPPPMAVIYLPGTVA